MLIAGSKVSSTWLSEDGGKEHACHTCSLPGHAYNPIIDSRPHSNAFPASKRGKEKGNEMEWRNFFWRRA